MQVLVTGSAGRVGQRVVALLRARGDTVTGFDLKPLGGTDGGYREVIGAFDDPAAVARAIQGAEVVLHLGAFMSWMPADAGRVYAANATGTFHLLAAAAAAKVRRFVLASTGEVYPEVRPRYLPLDESHPREPTSVYGLSKLLAEEMTAFFHRTQGLPFVVLRFSHTQDARELADPASFFSGPRFFLRSKIRQQREFGNTRSLAVLEPLDDGTREAAGPVRRGRHALPDDVCRRPRHRRRRRAGDRCAPGAERHDLPRPRRGDPAGRGGRVARGQDAFAGRAREPAGAGRQLHDVERACTRAPRLPPALDFRCR